MSCTAPTSAPGRLGPVGRVADHRGDAGQAGLPGEGSADGPETEYRQRVGSHKVPVGGR